VPGEGKKPKIINVFLKKIMIMYKCLRCQEEIDPGEIRKMIRCPFCGYKILAKTRLPIKKKIKAI
jgi:DNA-directed RNA polymerase subunit RPC12/RpoP